MVPLCNSGTNRHDSSTHARCIPSSPHAACLLAHCRICQGEQPPLPFFLRSTPPRYKNLTKRARKQQENSRNIPTPPSPFQDPLQQIVVVVPTTKNMPSTQMQMHTVSNTIVITITSSTCPSPCPSSPPQPLQPRRLPWSTDSPCRCRTAPGRPCRHSP